MFDFSWNVHANEEFNSLWVELDLLTEAVSHRTVAEWQDTSNSLWWRLYADNLARRLIGTLTWRLVVATLAAIPWGTALYPGIVPPAHFVGKGLYVGIHVLLMKRFAYCSARGRCCHPRYARGHWGWLGKSNAPKVTQTHREDRELKLLSTPPSLYGQNIISLCLTNLLSSFLFLYSKEPLSPTKKKKIRIVWVGAKCGETLGKYLKSKLHCLVLFLNKVCGDTV